MAHWNPCQSVSGSKALNSSLLGPKISPEFGSKKRFCFAFYPLIGTVYSGNLFFSSGGHKFWKFWQGDH